MRRMAASVASRRAVQTATALVLLWMLAIPYDAPALTTQELQQIVEQFFPQELIDESEADFQQGGPAPFRARAFRLADLDGIGTANYVVAAYTNGFGAAIRLLRLQGSTATLVFEPTHLLLIGIRPAVELVDIENDGRPEVAVHFSGGRGTLTDWVFKWSGSELRLIGPFTVDEHGYVSTDLFESGFFDVDGDGVLEIVQGPLEDTEVYRFDGQKFTLTKSLVFFSTFYRREGIPVLQRAEFEVAKSGGGFVLTIVNGDRNGDNRVSSGTVKLNGAVVLTPNDLNQQVRKVVRRVTTLAENVLEVELAAKPSGQILVTVEHPPR